MVKKISKENKQNVRIINTKEAPEAVGPYSHAAVVTGGTTIYTCGCVGLDLKGKLVGNGDLVKETK